MESTNLYANRVEISSTVYDILFSFYQTFTIKNEDGETISEDKGMKANIVMSPQHAKALMNALNQQINWYEESYGEIKLQNNEIISNKEK